MLKYVSLSQFEFFDQVWSIDYFVNLTLTDVRKRTGIDWHGLIILGNISSFEADELIDSTSFAVDK